MVQFSSLSDTKICFLDFFNHVASFPDKYTDEKKNKKNSNSTEIKLRIYGRRTGVISSIHNVKSQFPLSIFIILGILQVIDWIQQ